ncbi:hypothetical protein DFJ63DRAFT_334263 [Scheffersomyces coipomensis]|uniref:uncharacterized protein n=1 Tax=Scheffersomyces coipomensis TaxID=1788519 RepID=UPI00315C638D
MENRSDEVVATESFKANSANTLNNSPSSLQQQLNTALTSSTLSANILSMSSGSGILELKSPFPRITFSPISKIMTKSNFTVKKNIEELVETEEYYINCLKILINYYIEPYLFNNNSEIPVPLSLMNLFLRELIQIHTQILYDIINDYSQLNQQHQIETLVEKIAYDLTKSEYSIYIYQEYCNVYENVLQLLGQPHPCLETKNKPKNMSRLPWNFKWLKGWELYLEASQPRSRHLDLSFPSLIQRPTARMGKYKLILEAINKSQSFKLVKYINILNYNLNWINNNCKNCQIDSSVTSLNDVIDFRNVITENNLNSEYFGNPFLIGCTNCIWIETKSIKQGIFATILYKSHLLLVEAVENSKLKCDIKFIIPLSKSQLIKNIRDSDGGLYFNHPYCIKILFEDNYCQYELLFAMNTEQEFYVWNNYLDTHINVINGPYRMDFSNIEITSLCKFPNLIIPYNVSLNYMSSKSSNLCYFNESKVFELPMYQNKKNDNEYGYVNLMSHDDFNKRNYIEKTFKSFWSTREIPLLTISEEVVENVIILTHSLKKSFSQSSTRFKHSIKSNFKSSSNLYEFWKSSTQKRIK